MDATTYLQNEVQKINKSIKTLLIAMVVVVIVMMGYFQFMRAQLAKLLEPESVSDFVINQTRSALPQIAESLKYNVTSEAPNLVHFVLTQALEKVLPLAGQTFQTNLEQYTHDVNTLAADKSMAALQGATRSYKASGVKQTKEDPAAFATRLSAHMEAQMSLQLDDVAKDGVKLRLDASGETLKHINEELVAMAQRPATDREGEMGKRLITTWWSFLDRGRPQVPNEQMDVSSAKKK